MGWNKIPPPKPTPPGQWEAFSYGKDYRGWILRCGPAFHAHITSSGGDFYTELNSKGLPVQKDLAKAQAIVEEKIINNVRAMLPAYTGQTGWSSLQSSAVEVSGLKRWGGAKVPSLPVGRPSMLMKSLPNCDTIHTLWNSVANAPNS